MNPFQCFVEVESISTRADHSLKLVLGTQELPPHSAALLFELMGTKGWMAMIPGDDPVKLEDIQLPEKDPEFPEQKTPSQRLRAVLFVAWDQGGRKESFDQFYASMMEKFITQVKEILT